MSGRSTRLPLRSKISTPVAAQDGPVAFVEIGDGVGERRQRDGIRAKVHLARAVTDGERAALPRGDHQIVVPGKDDGEGEGALQAAEAHASPLPRA